MLRKIAEIKVPTGAGAREARTEPVFASYDRQGAAFAFYFSDSIIAGTKANLLFVTDGQKVFVDDNVTLTETNETHTFTYPLPDELLNYTGKIDGYLYFDFEDGSHSDEIHFVFTIKKSQIDEEMEDAPDVYIKSFEDVKAEVQEAADGAKETISKKLTEVSDTSDSAISKVNQVAKNADQAKSDVQSKAGEASESIGEAVKSTESARDEAVKTMTDLDYSDRNLLTGTSSEWKEYSFDGYTVDYFNYTPEQLGLSTGDPLTYSAKFDNTKDTNNDASVYIFVNFYSNDNKVIRRITGNNILSGEVGLSYGTKNVPEGTAKIQAYGVAKSEGVNKKIVSAKEHKIQRGTLATSWTPAPEDIALKSDIEQIKKAIINLGGEI